LLAAERPSIRYSGAGASFLPDASKRISDSLWPFGKAPFCFCGNLSDYSLLVLLVQVQQGGLNMVMRAASILVVVLGLSPGAMAGGHTGSCTACPARWFGITSRSIQPRQQNNMRGARELPPTSRSPVTASSLRSPLRLPLPSWRGRAAFYALYLFAGSDDQGNHNEEH
jgi:hypothetical protein